jgi:hypothetical protein
MSDCYWCARTRGHEAECPGQRPQPSRQPSGPAKDAAPEWNSPIEGCRYRGLVKSEPPPVKSEPQPRVEERERDGKTDVHTPRLCIACALSVAGRCRAHGGGT